MSRINFPKIYNPANQSPQELIDNFVVRTKVYKDIFNDIKNSKMDYPEQHYIIQGVRGQGKTTLMLRISYEIEKNKKLRQRLIPVVFNEEQYNISRLYKLWESAAEYLSDMDETKGLYEEMQKLENDDDYEWKCFQLLENALKKGNKKLILFIDNIDEMLTKFSKKEHHRLREVFIESAELRIIGASSVSLEFHYDYGKPFYQFFKMPQLKGLNTEDTKTLLLKLGEFYKRERVKDIVENQPGRIEALRRITGGVIRTIIILFEIFVDDAKGNAYIDLEKVLDNVTPLYKHRMDKLSAQQQEIVDFIALKWDAVSAQEIARKTKLQSKAVSAQLKTLQNYHLIEKEKTDTKNYLYRISERFFNIWYLMRQGRKWDEKRVRFLVEFLQIWCDEQELRDKARKHLTAIQGGKVYDKYALFMTEALARTQIDRELQHELITVTKWYLQKSKSEYEEYLSTSDIELRNLFINSLEKEDLQSAASYLEKIKSKTTEDLVMLGSIYAYIKINLDKAKEYLLQAIERENSFAMYNLAWLHENEFEDYIEAEKYYLMAVKKDHSNAMFNLANIYREKFKDFNKAEKYYLLAVKKGHSEAMFNLAFMYQFEIGDIDKSEKYYLMAAERNHIGAMNNLGNFYLEVVSNIEKAEKYYLMAVEGNHTDAMNNLAHLYETNFKESKKAEKYYIMAVERNHTDAMNNLAYLYEKSFKDYKKAEKYYLMAVERKYWGSCNNLGNLYLKQFKDLKKSEEYYLVAVEKGIAIAMFNLALLYQNDIKDTRRAEKYYLMAIEKGHTEAMFNLATLYRTQLMNTKKAEKYYQMALEKDDINAMNELAWLYFENVTNKLKAFEFAEQSYNKAKNIFNAHTYTMILLWNNEIKKAFEIAQGFLKNKESFENFPEDISLFLMLLIAKKQYHLSLKIFNENPYNLKDRFKPIYYALMFFMQKEFPNEYRKMGGELKQTVEEIIEKINKLEKDYQ